MRPNSDRLTINVVFPENISRVHFNSHVSLLCIIDYFLSTFPPIFYFLELYWWFHSVLWGLKLAINSVFCGRTTFFVSWSTRTTGRAFNQSQRERLGALSAELEWFSMLQYSPKHDNVIHLQSSKQGPRTNIQGDLVHNVLCFYLKGRDAVTTIILGSAIRHTKARWPTKSKRRNAPRVEVRHRRVWCLREYGSMAARARQCSVLSSRYYLLEITHVYNSNRAYKTVAHQERLGRPYVYRNRSTYQ